MYSLPSAPHPPPRAGKKGKKRRLSYTGTHVTPDYFILRFWYSILLIKCQYNIYMLIVCSLFLWYLWSMMAMSATCTYKGVSTRTEKGVVQHLILSYVFFFLLTFTSTLLALLYTFEVCLTSCEVLLWSHFWVCVYPVVKCSFEVIFRYVCTQLWSASWK